MKKILLFVLLFISAEVTFGQFALGIKVGYNANKLSSNLDSVKSSFSSGFHVGAFARIGKRVFLQPEFYYTMSGGSFTVNTKLLQDITQKVTVGSLDIPVLIGFKIINSKIFNWRIMVGPQVSFLVNSKLKDVSLTDPIQSATFSNVNWYIQAGTGIDVLFLTLDIRYQAGLNSMINDVVKNGATYASNSKNNMFVVSLGFKIL
jgi:hypothetical protein